MESIVINIVFAILAAIFGGFFDAWCKPPIQRKVG